MDDFPKMTLDATGVTLDRHALLAAQDAFANAEGKAMSLSVEIAIKTYVMLATWPARQEEQTGREKSGGFGSYDGYAELESALLAAYQQAAAGKGKTRHANGKPFIRQPVMEIARMVGLPYHTGQIQKKVQEATSMAARGEIEAAKAELLGAINYAAAAWLFLSEQTKNANSNGDHS